MSENPADKPLPSNASTSSPTERLGESEFTELLAGGTLIQGEVSPNTQWPVPGSSPSNQKTTPLSGPASSPPSGPASSPPSGPASSPPSASASHQPLPADLVLAGGQGFQKLNRLGKGEFGEVWHARAPGGVEVAVKVILRKLGHEASQRELKALEQIRGLRHPFLLQTHQYQSEQDHLVIVMELADKSLSDRQKECLAEGLPGIPAEELADYFMQAAEALDYLHSQHVTHRDIKPQNLLMQRGHAKVADFGLARAMDETMAEASTVCGTPHYMAPEVWGGHVTFQGDQYALAVTWFEMRTGKRLFEVHTPYELLAHHMSSEPKLDALPPAEQEVLRRALAKDPANRYPTCMAFARALKEAIAPSISTAPPTVVNLPTAPPPPAPSAPPRGRNKGVFVAVGCVLIAGVCIVMTLMLRGNREAKQAGEQPPRVAVDWKPPENWSPVNPDDLVTDRKGRHFYRQLVREVAGQRVVLVLVPQQQPDDPPTFYIMENKVWNDLYAAFINDPKSQELFILYKRRPNCENVVGGEWKLGARAASAGPPPMMIDLGVGSKQGRVPALRMKVTEAHCFAQWLVNGQLPSKKQFFKAAGLLETKVPEALNGNPDGLAVNLGNSGPWEVSRGDRDVSLFGCRQMLTNGYEWTRTLADDAQMEIPLSDLNLNHQALYVGHSYMDPTPPTFDDVQETRSRDVTSIENLYDVGFRVVLAE